MTGGVGVSIFLLACGAQTFTLLRIVRRLYARLQHTAVLYVHIVSLIWYTLLRTCALLRCKTFTLRVVRHASRALSRSLLFTRICDSMAYTACHVGSASSDRMTDVARGACRGGVAACGWWCPCQRAACRRWGRAVAPVIRMSRPRALQSLHSPRASACKAQ